MVEIKKIPALIDVYFVIDVKVRRAGVVTGAILHIGLVTHYCS